MFYILVVLYQKNIAESETLQGLIASSELLKDNVVVHIWDNSPVACLNENDIAYLSEEFTLTYTHCTQNKPLSYVYNTIIDVLNASGKYQYFVLLDHDSRISAEYFGELYNITKSHPAIDIILPQAKSNELIISPAKFVWVKGNYFKDPKPGLYNGKLLAINSGMAISATFLNKYNFKYDERLLSYGTDNYFMNFANKKNALFYIMRYRFSHGYSFYELKNNKKRIEVFKQIKRANEIAFSSTTVQSFLIHAYNVAASIKNAVKYKSLKFLGR